MTKNETQFSPDEKRDYIRRLDILGALVGAIAPLFAQDQEIRQRASEVEKSKFNIWMGAIFFAAILIGYLWKVGYVIAVIAGVAFLQRSFDIYVLTHRREKLSGRLDELMYRWFAEGQSAQNFWKIREFVQRYGDLGSLDTEDDGYKEYVEWWNELKASTSDRARGISATERGWIEFSEILRKFEENETKPK